MSEKGVDTERYYPIGMDFHSGTSELIYLSIICVNKKSEDGKYVQIHFHNEMTYADFFSLFKRFNVILAKKSENLEDIELDDIDTISIEDRD